MAFTVKLEVPVALGVPEMKLRARGRWAATQRRNRQVIEDGLVPPLDANVCE